MTIHFLPIARITGVDVLKSSFERKLMLSRYVGRYRHASSAPHLATRGVRLNKPTATAAQPAKQHEPRMAEESSFEITYVLPSMRRALTRVAHPALDRWIYRRWGYSSGNLHSVGVRERDKNRPDAEKPACF